MNSIVEFFKLGGFFMYVILMIQIVGIVILVERIITIRFKNRIDTTTFVSRIIDYLQNNNPNKAIEYCNISNAALPRICKIGLQEYGRSSQQVQDAFELAAMHEMPKLEKRTSYLSMIANIATLLGLLGTIFGLIESFQAVANAEASQKAELLTSGIAMAMNTTAYGLIVAIPCLIGFAYITEATNELAEEINESVTRIFRRMVSSRG